MSEPNEEDPSKSSKAKDIAKKGIKSGISFGKKAGQFIKETVEEAIEEERHESSKMKPVDIQETEYRRRGPQRSYRARFGNLTNATRSEWRIERGIANWYSFIGGMFMYFLIIVVATLIGTLDTSFRFLTIILILGFPIFFVWRLQLLIPWFDFRDFFRNSWYATRLFFKEMYRISPFMVTVLGAFVLLLVYVLIRNIVIVFS